MNSSCRTYDNTLSAKFALGVVDISDIAFYSDSVMRTSLRAKSATDAGCLTSLTCDRTFILVHTRHEHTHVARSFVPEFDDRLRTCFHTSTASHTFFLIHDRKTSLFIHGKSTEFAGLHTVAATKTSERTSSVTGIKRRLHLA